MYAPDHPREHRIYPSHGGDPEMGFNATVIEVVLIALVGGTIGFVTGLRLGAYMADSKSPAEPGPGTSG